MKVTKLIIPLLGLSQMNNNNANKQELLQLEKLPEISYEVLAKDNWDNYYLNNDILTDKNVNESLTQDKIIVLPNSQRNGFGKPVQLHTPEECMQMLQAALTTRAFLGPFAVPCVAAAWAAYYSCLACSC